MFPKIGSGILVLLAVARTTAPSAAGEPERTTKECHCGADFADPKWAGEFKEDTKRLLHLAEGRDLTALDNFANDGVQKWQARDAVLYFDFLAKVTNAFTSHEFVKPGRYEFARKYAKLAFDVGDDVPLESEARIAMSLVSSGPRLGSQATAEQLSTWRKFRSELVTELLHVQGRIDKNLDPRYPMDSKLPLLNVPTVVGDSTMVLGIPEDAKNDPESKARYEQYIAAMNAKAKDYERRVRENNELIKQSKEQTQLAYVDRFFSSFSDSTIIDLYTRKPYDTADFVKLADGSSITKDRKSLLTDSIVKGSK